MFRDALHAQLEFLQLRKQDSMPHDYATVELNKYCGGGGPPVRGRSHILTGFGVLVRQVKMFQVTYCRHESADGYTFKQI
jgi:hypothetical protein